MATVWVLSYLLGFFERALADFVLTCEIVAACCVGWFLVVFVGGLVLGLWNEQDSLESNLDCCDRKDFTRRLRW